MAKINHLSHGLADIAGRTVKGNLARDGAPKHVTGIEVAHGQRSRSSGADILSGSAKRLTVTAPSFGQRSRGPRPAEHMAALGEAMLREAFAAADGATCQAHGRNKDGSKC
jgi:hypothetical protein